MKPRRRKGRLRRHAWLLLAVGFVLAVAWVWKSSEADRLSRLLTKLERSKRSMIEHNKLLGAQLEEFRSPAWVDGRARELGMTYDIKKRRVLFETVSKKPETKQSLFASVGDFLGRLYENLVKQR